MVKAYTKAIEHSLKSYTVPESWLKEKPAFSFPVTLGEKIYSLLLKCDDAGKIISYDLSELKALPGLPLAGIEEIEEPEEIIEDIIEEDIDDVLDSFESEEEPFLTRFSGGASYEDFIGMTDKDSTVPDPN